MRCCSWRVSALEKKGSRFSVLVEDPIAPCAGGRNQSAA